MVIEYLGRIYPPTDIKMRLKIEYMMGIEMNIINRNKDGGYKI